MEYNLIVTGLLIFFARICDVSIGTVRTIMTVQGRTVISFILAFFEITIWVLVASTVINQLKEKPILIVFYAFGYATGNVVGIVVERKLAFGVIILKLLTRTAGQKVADYLREKGQPVTVFVGEGMKGPVSIPKREHCIIHLSILGLPDTFIHASITTVNILPDNRSHHTVI